MTKQNRRLDYLKFVKDYFGEPTLCHPRQAGCEILKVAPQGLPKCFLTCGFSLSEEPGAGRYELMLNTSASFDEAFEDRIGCELDRIGREVSREKELPVLVAFSEGFSPLGYSHALLWSVGQWEENSDVASTVLALIPLFDREADWIRAHAPQEFALAYHAQVSEEAFFNLDVLRDPVDPDAADTAAACAFEL